MGLRSVTAYGEALPDGRHWLYGLPEDREVPEPKNGLGATLVWILNQLALDNYQIGRDAQGKQVSLLIGRDAAPIGETPEMAKVRGSESSFGLILARQFARWRETGIEPKGRSMSDRLVQHPGFRWLTELCYADEFARLLQGIAARTLGLSVLPIERAAPKPLLAYLGEATQSYFFGFHLACVALCRACLEEALKRAVSEDSIKELKKRKGGRGELYLRIRAAEESGVLPAELAAAADRIRTAGNKVLHHQHSGAIAEKVLSETREIVGHLFRPES